MTYANKVDALDFYQLLGVPKDASSEEIKRAYHSLILQHHPDKRPRSSTTTTSHNPSPKVTSLESNATDDRFLDVDQLVEAYRILSDASSRETYDRSLVDQAAANLLRQTTGPRPAKVVSLDEFEEAEEETPDGSAVFIYPCRCGGLFSINEALLEDDIHLLACDSCSEAIWVGYEAVVA